MRTTTVYPALPLLSAAKPETRNLDSPLRFVPHPSILFYVRLSRATLALPPLSIRLTALFSFSTSLSPFFLLRVPSILILATQLARLFIKTSKLTGFNRVRFTLFVCALVYYLLRYKQHPTFSLLTPRFPPSLSLSAPLILSRKSRPPDPIPPQCAFIRLSFIPSPLYVLLFLSPWRLHHPPSIVQPLVT